MSSILKALKKLEDEKTARRPDSLKIDAEILRGGSARRTSPLAVILVATVLFVCGAGATYVYMKRNTGNIAVRESVKPALIPAKNQITPLPAPATINIEYKNDNGNPDKGLQPEKITVPRTEAKHTNISQFYTAHSRTIIKSQSVQAKKPSVSIKPAVESTQPAVEPVSHPATPTIKVNGIAYQDGRADSVAVVNGTSVSKGSVIDGAKVEEIQMDRVRFSYGSEKFEVNLGKSNR
jgi:general secretion pathway protein B